MPRKPTVWSVILVAGLSVAQDSVAPQAACSADTQRINSNYLWKGMREELRSERRLVYFHDSLKSALVPGEGVYPAERFHARLLEAQPPVNPRVLLVAIEGQEGEALLKMERPLRGSMEIGSHLQFVGVVMAMREDPFRLTFLLDKKHLWGWAGR